MKYEKYYKLIFLDYSMQDMSGPECAKKILKTINKINHPQIIALTGYSDEQTQNEFKESGVYQWTTKPMLSDKLK